MAKHDPKQLSAGAHSVTDNATTTLETIPADTRWIINSFKFEVEWTAQSGGPTYTVNAGGLELLKWTPNGLNNTIPAGGIVASGANKGRGFVDLLEVSNSDGTGNVRPHEPLTLETGDTIEVVCDTAGGNTFAGTYNISGDEVTDL